MQRRSTFPAARRLQSVPRSSAAKCCALARCETTRDQAADGSEDHETVAHQCVATALAAVLAAAPDESTLACPPSPNMFYECYICTEAAEPAELRHVCTCTDRFVHLDCQRELVEKLPAHALSCPACRSPYTNVSHTLGRPQLTRESQVIAVIVVNATILVGLGVQQLVLYYGGEGELHWMTAVFGVFFLWLVVALCFFMPYLKPSPWFVRPKQVMLATTTSGGLKRQLTGCRFYYGRERGVFQEFHCMRRECV